MRVHHLDCGPMRPFGNRLLTGRGLLGPARLVAHCLLLETDRGLVLVDTGFGTADVADPARLGLGFRTVVRPDLSLAHTMLAQLRGLGHSPDDVTDIVVTHLDLDHIGGLSDFPRARVHVYGEELAAFTARASLIEQRRYLPAQTAHGVSWQIYAEAGETWHGFSAVRSLREEILLVPLPGHTRGHCGVVVDTGAGWLLHAGDAYFVQAEVAGGPVPAGVPVYQTLMEADRRARLENQHRLRELVASGSDVRVFCAHDPDDFDTLAG